MVLLFALFVSKILLISHLLFAFETINYTQNSALTQVLVMKRAHLARVAGWAAMIELHYLNINVL